MGVPDLRGPGGGEGLDPSGFYADPSGKLGRLSDLRIHHHRPAPRALLKKGSTRGRGRHRTQPVRSRAHARDVTLASIVAGAGGAALADSRAAV
jgi:hypothetical protein